MIVSVPSLWIPPPPGVPRDRGAGDRHCAPVEDTAAHRGRVPRDRAELATINVPWLVMPPPKSEYLVSSLKEKALKLPETVQPVSVSWPWLKMPPARRPAIGSWPSATVRPERLAVTPLVDREHLNGIVAADRHDRPRRGRRSAPDRAVPPEASVLEKRDRRRGGLPETVGLNWISLPAVLVLALA